MGEQDRRLADLKQKSADESVHCQHLWFHAIVTSAMQLFEDNLNKQDWYHLSSVSHTWQMHEVLEQSSDGHTVGSKIYIPAQVRTCLLLSLNMVRVV